MDTTTLVKERFDQGLELVESLADAGFDISCACWLLREVDDRWFLFIVSDVVDHRGALAAYREVYAKLAEIERAQLSISEIKTLGKKEVIAKELQKLIDDYRPSEPVLIEDGRLDTIGARAAYLYPRVERGSPGFAKLKREYPSMRIFSLRIPLKESAPIDWFFREVVPYMDKVNASEFEGKEPETVLCLGPRARSTEPFGQVMFAHRPEGWNKMFRADKNLWEEVVHIKTGKKLYETADFSPLLALSMR